MFYPTVKVKEGKLWAARARRQDSGWVLGLLHLANKMIGCLYHISIKMALITYIHTHKC